MPAWRDGGWTQPSFADRSVHRLLADTQEPRRLSRADQFCVPSLTLDRDPLDVVRQEASVASGGDGGGLEQPSCHGAKNGRPAHAQASC